MDQITNIVSNTLATVAMGLSDAAQKQALLLLAALVRSWPAIQAGLATAQPILDALGQVFGQGPLAPDTFDKIITDQDATLADIDAQIAKDDAAANGGTEE